MNLTVMLFVWGAGMVIVYRWYLAAACEVVWLVVARRSTGAGPGDVVLKTQSRIFPS